MKEVDMNVCETKWSLGTPPRSTNMLQQRKPPLCSSPCCSSAKSCQCFPLMLLQDHACGRTPAADWLTTDDRAPGPSWAPRSFPIDSQSSTTCLAAIANIIRPQFSGATCSAVEESLAYIGITWLQCFDLFWHVLICTDAFSTTVIYPMSSYVQYIYIYTYHDIIILLYVFIVYVYTICIYMRYVIYGIQDQSSKSFRRSV